MSAPPPTASDDDTVESSFDQEGEEIDLETSMVFRNKQQEQAVVETATPVASAPKAVEPDPEQAKPNDVDDDSTSSSEYTYEPGLISKRCCCLCCVMLALIAAVVCAIYFGIGPKQAIEVSQGGTEPTQAPTSTPTVAPTAAPTTPAPTVSPTAAPTSQLFADILELLLPFTPQETLLDETTPQGQAFRQLVAETEESGGETIPHRIHQRYGLMTLYLSTNPSGWTTRTGWSTFTANECDWYGIGTCRALEQADDGSWVYGVANIELGNNGLSGDLPTEMCALAEYIESLDVSSNALTGSIPACLKDFVKLRDVNMSDNQLAGELPTGLLAISTMGSIDLSQNQIRGDASSLFGDDLAAVNLNTVRLHTNLLTGDFPDAVASFSGLNILMLHGNEMVGEVPATICEMQGLNTFLTTLTADCGAMLCECCTACF